MQRSAAIAALEEDFYSASLRASMQARFRSLRYGAWILSPTVDKVLYLGAALKACGYRAASADVSAYRQACRRQGFCIAPEVELTMSDVVRSCTRGLGGPVRARGLPLDRLHLLPSSRAPAYKGGPISPRNLLVVGAW